MRGIRRHIIVAAALSALLCAGTANAARDVSAQLAAEKKAADSLAKETKAISKEVATLKKRLISGARNLRRAEEKTKTAKAQLKELQNKKEKAQEQLVKTQAAVGSLTTATRLYNATPVPVLMLQTDPVSAARAARIMKTTLPRMQKNAKKLRDELAKLAQLEHDIKNSAAQYTAQQKKQQVAHKKLSTLLENRRNLYKKTAAARKAQVASVAKLAKEAKTLEDLLQKTGPKPKPRRVAAITPRDAIMPVSGKVVTAFNGTDALGAKSKGITLAADAGATVVSPLSGTVKFAGPFQKFRQILIIAHAGGYHSLIAGLDRIDTVTGAKLEAGEPVGTAPDDTDIYYELRHNGTPVNPKKVILAQRKQDKS